MNAPLDRVLACRSRLPQDLDPDLSLQPFLVENDLADDEAQMLFRSAAVVDRACQMPGRFCPSAGNPTSIAGSPTPPRGGQREGAAMADEGIREGREKPANDNHLPDEQESASKPDASEKLDAVVLSIARLIGRQMAREEFAARIAANDNRAGSAGSAEDDG